MNDHVIVAKSQGGRPTKYDPSVIPEVRSWCQMGATVDDLAGFLDVDRATIHRWMLVHPEFCDAMRIGREAADARGRTRALREGAGGRGVGRQQVAQQPHAEGVGRSSS